MNEPRRLRDDGSASGEIRELVRGARRSRSMSPGERSRSAARLAPVLALPVAGSAWLSAKGIALAAVVCTAGAVGARALIVPRYEAPPPTEQAPPLEKPASQATSAPEATAVAPEPQPTAAPRVAMTARPRIDAPPVRTESANEAPPAAQLEDSLAREAALLEQARAALAANPSEALLRLEQHAATFPGGKLGLERELLTIDALRRVGRYREARTRGEALLARSSGGLYGERVRRILDSMPSSIP